MKSTTWPKLGDPNIYIDVNIVKPRRVMDTMHEEHAMGLANGRIGKRSFILSVLKNCYLQGMERLC